MENFRRFLEFFLQFFWNFLQFFWNFLQFFGKFSQKFLQFFSTFAIPLRFSENFSENSCPQSVTVQPGSRHYCKFTSKFTTKFTLILIKILQSTKFEGSHFFNSLTTFTASYGSLSIFPTLCPLPKPFPLFALLSSRRRVFPTIAPPCQRHQRPSLPLRRRRYVGNTRDYK